MASLPNTITIEMQLRPCRVFENDTPETGVFHKWVIAKRKNRFPEVQYLYGVVELDDGSVMLVEAEEIRFIDGLAKTILEDTDTMHIADDTPENKIFK